MGLHTEKRLIMENDQFFRRFCYPNGCLKNKLGIHDAKQLATQEFQTVCHQIQLILTHAPRIGSLNDLCMVHQQLFGSIYTWAGQVRTDYDLHKRTGGMDFFAQPAATIPLAWQYIENELLKPMLKEKQPTMNEYMKLLDNINTLHPFREGNGRSTKAFLQLVAIQHHQYLHFPRHQMKLIMALNAANYQRMAEQILLINSDNVVRDYDQEAPFNDHQQIICGHHFTSQAAYRIARDSVLFNLYEGWQPNDTDIREALSLSN